MSETEAEAQLIYNLQWDAISCYIAMACIAFLAYDQILTARDDVELIWTRNKSVSSILYLLNRILAFVLIGSLAFEDRWSVSTSSLECNVGQFILVSPELLQFILWAVFSALRTYAVGGRAWIAACTVLLLNLVPVAVNVWREVAWGGYRYDPSSYSGCTLIRDPLPTSVNDPLPSVLVTRLTAIVADIVVVGITWTRTYTLVREARHCDSPQSVATMLLRDGTILFILLALFNVGEIIAYQTTQDSLSMTVLLSSAMSIFISRFLLNLRTVGSYEEHEGPYSSAHESTLRFASAILQDMGAQLSFGGSAEDELHERESEPVDTGRLPGFELDVQQEPSHSAMVERAIEEAAMERTERDVV